MSESPFKELQDAHRVWEFRNKTNKIQTISLAENDSIKVKPKQEGGFIKLQSSKFHQLPSIADFQFIKPTLDDLRAVGLLDNDSPKSNSSSSTTQPPAVVDEE